MITANELRIGNLLQGDKISIHILQMYGDGIMSITGQGISYIEQGIDLKFKPIPISRKLLLRFGFKPAKPSWFEKDDYNWIYEIKKHDIEISIAERNTTEKELDTFLHEGSALRHIKFIHQLQNLFHSLTGHEIELK